MGQHTIDELRMKQALPLDVKVRMTKIRIREWINEWGEDGVYVSFSGGKDSTVLLHLVREDYPNVPAVFVDTGLEYPEIREFVKKFDNVTWLKPKMNFKQVINKYGYPFFSKEVSEVVYGAKRYLTSIMNGKTIVQTDRQTDRQTAYCYDYERITATGRYLPPLKLLQENNKAKHIYKYETDRLLGTCHSRRICVEERESSEELQDLANILNERKNNREGGSNQRLAQLLGLLTKDQTIEVPKENTPNRSGYSLEKYQFMLEAPFEISNRCCNVMKKAPVHAYARETGRKPITGQMAAESRLRTQKWLQQGCNAFDSAYPISNPMSFWTEQDVLQYIKQNNIEIASVYGDITYESDQMDICEFGLAEDVRKLKTTGCNRTGCMFCCYGIHLEKSPNRFERMKETHPKQYDYIMRPKDQGGLGYKEIMDWINEHGNMNIKY